VLLGKLMYLVTKGKVNPLIGSAGVSAVPMAARVSQVEGRKANPTNFLPMHVIACLYFIFSRTASCKKARRLNIKNTGSSA